MNQIYRAIGTSKQNVHQRLNRYLAAEEQKILLLGLIDQIRVEHPAMGAKMLYRMLQPEAMGRDAFIGFYNEHNLQVRPARNYRKTTNSNGVIRFPNLLGGRELTHVNQAFVSDITYYRIRSRFYYLTFIMDLYSRMIKGFCASDTLQTVRTSIPAAKMVVSWRGGCGNKSIFHSDGGGQYYCKAFLELTKDHFLNSMGEAVYDNTHAERINGIIKNDYLRCYNPQSFRELKKMLTKAVGNYNTKRPHQSLAHYTPEQVEKGYYSYKLKVKKVNPENYKKSLN